MDDLPDLEKAPLLAEPASSIRHYDTNTQEVPSLTEDVHNQQVLCDSIYSDRNARNTRLLPNNVPQPFVYLGYCCAILAGLCFTSSNVMVKYIPDVNSWQLLFVRCVSQLLAMFPIMWHGKHSMFGTPDLATRWRIGAQGVLGGILLLCIFVAVARMPLGDCTAIFFSSPAFTMVRYRSHITLILNSSPSLGAVLHNIEGPLWCVEMLGSHHSPSRGHGPLQAPLSLPCCTRHC